MSAWVGAATFMRFGDLPQITVVVRTANELSDESRPMGMSCAAVRWPAWTVEIDGVLRVLDELTAWGRSDPPSREWPPSDHAEHERFVARETGRIGGYVVFACNVADMIEHEAARIHRLLDLLEPASRATRKKAREKHRAALAISRLLRHKVFAHTAAVSRPPKGKKPDPLSVRATSVLFVSGNGSGWRSDEFRLGLGQMTPIDGGEEQIPLPSVSLREVHAEANAAFDAWWTLLSMDIERIQGFSDAALRTAMPGLLDVIRTPRHTP